MESSFIASTFGKTARCPSAETLLSYERKSLRRAEQSRVEAHLKFCDFCSAELQLLTLHRNEVEEYRLTEMPSRLRYFAESLFAQSRLAQLRRHRMSH